ncbi:hypothetical protein [Ligilactobacillus equi]|uniref:Uncharacterized protein n=1 Tax=Ligilactobacillus equi DSM 15833 = JCM 10991 TaxID=1423740 RepID=A0A0R1TQY9_9LACO|nr:hypothetical protein [Ligilactobacillus equi]KRL80661.1 hypothetical protein FC36_GL002117 [Ligilactobacillus equi DSM 15833 = JCM 10991]
MKKRNKQNYFIFTFANFSAKSLPGTVATLATTTLIMLVYGGLSLVQNKPSSVTPLKLQTSPDWVLTIGMAVSLIVAIVFTIFIVKKREMSIYTKYLGSFLTVMTATNWIGMIMMYPSRKVTTKAVIHMVNVTYVYNYLVVATCVVGIVWGAFLTKKMLKKTNWWLFVVCIPYFAVLNQVAITIAGLTTLTGYSDYSPKIVKIIINTNKYGDINLMNQSLYYLITYQIIALIFMFGGKIIVFVYTKTKKRVQKIQRKLEKRRKGIER